MTNSNDLIVAMSRILGLNFSSCRTVFRELRSAELVSNSGPGRQAAAMTVRDAATYLIALCAAEQVQDAADAVARYSPLWSQSDLSKDVPVSSPTWQKVEREFPRLAALPIPHEFFDALAALIESYIDGSPAAQVTVSFQNPYPWASIAIGTTRDDVSIIDYRDEGDEDGPGELAKIDSDAKRNRRKFAALGGDLNVTARITGRTLATIGALLR